MNKTTIHNLLHKHKIPKASWILTSLERKYGKAFVDEYIEKITNETCWHGFIDDCPYCRWGTD